MYRLITLDGMAAKPEAHQAFIENPLVPVDYVTVRERGEGGADWGGRRPYRGARISYNVSCAPEETARGREHIEGAPDLLFCFPLVDRPWA